jgi:hypothetical protein
VGSWRHILSWKVSENLSYEELSQRIAPGQTWQAMTNYGHGLIHVFYVYVEKVINVSPNDITIVGVHDLSLESVGHTREDSFVFYLRPENGSYEYKLISESN